MREARLAVEGDSAPTVARALAGATGPRSRRPRGGPRPGHGGAAQRGRLDRVPLVPATPRARPLARRPLWRLRPPGARSVGVRSRADGGRGPSRERGTRRRPRHRRQRRRRRRAAGSRQRASRRGQVGGAGLSRQRARSPPGRRDGSDRRRALPARADPLLHGRRPRRAHDRLRAPSAGALGALLRRPREQPVDSIRLLAFGDPDFAARWATRCASLASRSRQPRTCLGFRDPERRRGWSARYAAVSDVRLRRDASVDYLRHTPLERYEVIHFATHALVDDRALGRTVLALAPGSSGNGLVTPGELAGSASTPAWWCSRRAGRRAAWWWMGRESRG